jgi:hypothetical protein
MSGRRGPRGRTVPLRPTVKRDVIDLRDRLPRPVEEQVAELDARGTRFAIPSDWVTRVLGAGPALLS